MGNQQTKKLKVKKGKQNPLQKLDNRSLSIICSFLELSDFQELLCTNRAFYQQFESVSSIYQRECKKYISFDLLPTTSRKWKILYRSLIQMPLQDLQFRDAILKVKRVPMTRPYLVQHPIQLTNFQKAILYYDKKLQGPRNMSEILLLNEAKQFRRSDILMNIRLGVYCECALPGLISMINNLHRIIEGYMIYIDIRLEDCDLQQFVQIWNHYSQWIAVIESESFQVVSLFNTLIGQTLPRYSVRWMMVRQFVKRVPEALKLKLRHDFTVMLKKCRTTSTNIDLVNLLQSYIRYLIDINSDQESVYYFGHTEFPYSNEIEALVKIVNNQSQQLCLFDEQLMESIFGTVIYRQHLFGNLFENELDRLKQVIKEVVVESMQEVTPNSEEECNYEFFNPIPIVRTILRSIREEYEEQCVKLEEEDVPRSISLGSTRNSNVLSSFCKTDITQFYNYLKQYQPLVINSLEQLLITQSDIHLKIQHTNTLVGNSIKLHPIVGYNHNLSPSDLEKYKPAPQAEQIVSSFSQISDNGQTLAQIINQQYSQN